VLLSRLSAPVRGVFEVAHVVDALTKVDVFRPTSPWGDVHCQPAELGPAVKDGPKGLRAASRAAASLMAWNSGATRENLVRPGLRDGARLQARPREGHVRPVALPPGPP
jgi:hypothetical protein